MSQERVLSPVSGWPMLTAAIIIALSAIALIVQAVQTDTPILMWAVALLVVVDALLVAGFLVLQPNEAAVLLLFGRYDGSVRRSGFWWVNPFYSKKKISMRLRNQSSERLKVNDKAGNPIEIASVIVWRVEDTYAAFFEVDDYNHFVTIQSESALRHLASRYPYDAWHEEDVISLRANIDEVSEALRGELQERLQKAGVVIQEARLSHLAYAQEIAEAMLKRQQAGAIVAARKTLVEGAVGMVRMALDQIGTEKIVEMDDERKAAMVSNLLVVLCGETNAQPVVNAGTLYH